MTLSRPFWYAAATAMLVLGCVPAQDVQSPDDVEPAAEVPGPGAPPSDGSAEAFAACQGKAAGDTCSVRAADADVEGLCDAPPGERRLACRPPDPPGS